MLGWCLPDNGSTIGVMHLVYWTSGVGLLVVQACLLRARHRRHTVREVIWAVVPALLLVWLGLLSHRTLPEVTDGRQIAFETSSPGDGTAQ